MASITGRSSRYGDGHKVVLKERSKIKSAKVLELFRKANYQPGTSVFTIKRREIKNPNIRIVLSEGPEQLFLMDKSNKSVMIMGNASTIDSLFNHYTTNSKSNTNTLTLIKENISMWMFESMIEKKKFLSEDEVIQKLGAAYKKYYDTTYYDSAVKQAVVLKNNLKKSGYVYERQADNLTKKLYEVGRKLSGKANDNWNPADVWMIKKNFNMKPLLESKHIDQLNDLIRSAYSKGDLIPISLKQVTNTTAKFSVVDPDSVLKSKKFEYDFTFDKVDLSDTFNNFILQTKSGFAIRAGFKASATTLNVSLEGRFIGAGYQLGAIDASLFPKHVLEKYKYSVRGGKEVNKKDYDIAKKEMKSIISKYPRFSNTLLNYKEVEKKFIMGDDLTQKRFANIVSYMYALLMTATNRQKFLELMAYCYYSSKKLVAEASMYVLIN